MGKHQGMSGFSNHDRRAFARRALLLNVRCHVTDDIDVEVWLTDLAASGCQLILRAGLLEKYRRIIIQPREIGALPGLVRWSFGTRAGVAFDRPLDEARIVQLLNALPKPSPPAQRTVFLDQFGRPLPQWPRAERSWRRNSRSG